MRHRRITLATVLFVSVVSLGALYSAGQEKLPPVTQLAPDRENFTEVREVILDSSEQQGYRVFDFDTVRSIEVPEELQKFQYTAARREQFQVWTRQQGGDVCYYQWDAEEFAKEAPEAYRAAERTPDFFGGIVLGLPRIMKGPWLIRGSKEFVPWQSLHFSQLRLVPVAEQAFDTMTAGEVMEIVDSQETLNHEKSVRTDYPGTYAFRTAAGAAGMLQISGPTDSGRKVSLRYRLVQQQ
jgi:hypothetical protein